jgi:hypothetical protein
MAVTAAKSVMAFRILTMALNLSRLTTGTMNVNAGHEKTSKARIMHQIQPIRGITNRSKDFKYTQDGYNFVMISEENNEQLSRQN